MSEYNLPIKCGNCGGPFGGCSCGQKRYEINKNYPDKGTNSQEVLLTIASLFRAISTIADQTSPTEKDSDSLFKLRAELISDLPRAIKGTTDFGSLHPDTLDDIERYREQANRALKSGGFPLYALLKPWGSKRGGPNKLDGLISRTFSS